MRSAIIFVHGKPAATLTEYDKQKFQIDYLEDYHGQPISLTLPVSNKHYEFDQFPSFFDGLLPEGLQLEALLRQNKIDRDDCFSQLITVGNDMVGAVTVEEAHD